jgi:hypothetical protein
MVEIDHVARKGDWETLKVTMEINLKVKIGRGILKRRWIDRIEIEANNKYEHINYLYCLLKNKH